MLSLSVKKLHLRLAFLWSPSPPCRFIFRVFLAVFFLLLPFPPLLHYLLSHSLFFLLSFSVTSSSVSLLLPALFFLLPFSSSSPLSLPPSLFFLPLPHLLLLFLSSLTPLSRLFYLLRFCLPPTLFSFPSILCLLFSSSSSSSYFSFLFSV